MRTRSRTSTPTWKTSYTIVTTYTGKVPPIAPPYSITTAPKLSFAVTEEYSVISDELALRPQVYVDPKTGRWRRFRYPKLNAREIPGTAARLFGKNRIFRPVQNCTHVTKKINLNSVRKDFNWTVVYYENGWERVDRTYSCPDSLSALQAMAITGNPATHFDSANQAYTAGAYLKTDWFALMDRFYEASESFCNDSFLAGESIHERAIYKDALKVVLNPTLAIRTLLRETGKFFSRKKQGRMRLGELVNTSKALAKKSASMDLFYKFAVKPAIEDIKAVLDAHSFVNGRLNYFRQNGGSWVPIRVRGVLDSSIENFTPAEPTSGSSKLFVNLAAKQTVSTISAWGHLREDLEWNDTWSAYLQYFGVGKLIGLGWELIPFSFCLDWFTNAQERINHFSRLRSGGPFLGIKGFCTSTKERLVKELFLYPYKMAGGGPYFTPPLNPMSLGQMTQSSYTRSPRIPSTSGVVDTSSLGLFHAVTATELVTQLWSRISRK